MSPRLVYRTLHRQPVLHKKNRPQDCVGHACSTKMLLDLPFAIEMGDSGTLVCAANRTVNKMANLGAVGRVNQSNPLPHLDISAILSSLHGEHAVYVFESAKNRRFIVVVAVRDLDSSLVDQSTRFRPIGISRQRANRETLGPQVPDNCAALFASGSGH